MSSNPIVDPPRILVAPLDWGLGHATRCIPIIRQLERVGATLFLGGEGATAALLRTEFPHLPLLPLKGYNIQYGKTRLELIGKILLQIPKVIAAMDEEHAWLDAAVKKYALDAVISDNRYGLYSQKAYSVFISHQLLVKTGFSSRADRLLQKLHYGYINAFHECWVPDNPAPPFLGGELSHPRALPSLPVDYIGPLSRFSRQAPAGAEKHLLVLLSGPEPQRTILENALLAQLEAYRGPVVLVRGLPGGQGPLRVAPNIQVHHHLPAAALQTLMVEASWVVARTGYSTVMDLMALQKKSILIPTPGQTEQEYLADHLMRESFALCLPQEGFRLQQALDLAARFRYRKPPETAERLKGVVTELIQTLKMRADSRSSDT